MKGLLKVLGVNLAVLAGGLLVAELVFGSWLFGDDYGHMNIPRDVHRTFDVTGLYAGGGTITYTRDEHGLRGPYGDPSAIDLLAIGGSTTNQLYLDDAQTWLARLRDDLARAGTPRVIVNAAVDGQSTRGHLALFERWFPLVPGLKARFVLAYVGVNDRAVEDAAQWDAMESPEGWRRWATLAKNKSALYGLWRTARGMIRAREAKLVHGSSPYDGADWVRGRPAADPAPVPADLAPRLAAYRQRLGRLIDSIRAFGARAIIVSQPTASYRVRDGWVYGVRQADGSAALDDYDSMMAFNAAAMAVCAEKGAICLDLGRDLAFEDGDFYDWVHNTPVGARKIGDYLYERLKGIL